MKEQSFNLNSNLFADFTTLFIKLTIAIFFIYSLVLIINFLRDKFISKAQNTKKADFLDLFTILNKLFFISGFGFIAANLVQALFSAISDRNQPISFGGEWKYLTFGVILVFLGISFKAIKKAIIKERQESKEKEL